jgi:hypothetical protein
MTTSNLIITGCEFGVIVLIIIGFIREEKFIRFEYHVKRVIKGNYRHFKRNFYNWRVKKWSI